MSRARDQVQHSSGLGPCPGRARRRKIPGWLVARPREPYDRSASRAAAARSYLCFRSVPCAGWPGRLRCAASWPRSPGRNRLSPGRERSAGFWFPASRPECCWPGRNISGVPEGGAAGAGWPSLHSPSPASCCPDCSIRPRCSRVASAAGRSGCRCTAWPAATPCRVAVPDDDSDLGAHGHLVRRPGARRGDPARVVGCPVLLVADGGTGARLRHPASARDHPNCFGY
jgi:hypothetical protein